MHINLFRMRAVVSSQASRSNRDATLKKALISSTAVDFVSMTVVPLQRQEEEEEGGSIVVVVVVLICSDHFI